MAANTYKVPFEAPGVARGQSEQPSALWVEARKRAQALFHGPRFAALTSEARSVLGTYASFCFASHPFPGLLCLLATFVIPAHGAAGLGGLLACRLWARLLRLPDAHVREGFLALNGALVGLAFGLFFRLTPVSVAILAALTLLVTLIAGAFRIAFERVWVAWGAVLQTLPFVLVTWLILLASRRFGALELSLAPFALSGVGSGVLPAPVELYLRTLAVSQFQVNLISGLLILAAWLWFSRWAVLLSVLGFGTGYWLYGVLGGPPSDLISEFVGFNFTFAAVGLGGVWVVLSPWSLALAVVGAALTTLVAAGSAAFFGNAGLPGFAFPFLLTTQVLMFVLRARSSRGKLRVVTGIPGSPEMNLAAALTTGRRYPDPAIATAYLPVWGRWLITQGPKGKLTHQGLWSHAWDFELADSAGLVCKAPGALLSDYYAYQVPVLAPRHGVVVRVVNHLPDNPIGEVDTAAPWGNLVILWHYADVYSALCHLQQGSICVYEGQSVSAGQMLGRVGNSGRSPVPHLHFQMQASAEIGAPTRYAELLHYTAHQQQSSQYLTHGVPQTGVEICALDADDEVRKAMTLAPGRRWTWRVQHGSKHWQEAWESHIDFYGFRRLTDTSGRASLGFYADHHSTTLFDYRGSAKRVLGLLYLAAATLPYLKETALAWRDAPNSAPFLSWPARRIQELALPFFEVAGLRTESVIQSRNGTVHVTTRLNWGMLAAAAQQFPDRIEVDFKAGIGPTALRAYRKTLLLTEAELLEATVLGAHPV